MIVFDYNDVVGFEEIMNCEGDKIVVVIFELVVGNMGCVLLSEGFLWSFE